MTKCYKEFLFGENDLGLTSLCRLIILFYLFCIRIEFARSRHIERSVMLIL